MHALFIHGMGRTPLSGWPLLRRLRGTGMTAGSFAYSATFESVSAIKARLVSRIADVSSQGDYVLIGHSLGGVLLRAALNALPPGTRSPGHVFLLGSPTRPSRLARQLAGQRLYGLFTGDCGALLASAERMAAIGAPGVPTTSIVGVRGLSASRGVFGDEPNDGVVAVSETTADWIGSQACIPVIHTLLPASGEAAGIILGRLGH